MPFARIVRVPSRSYQMASGGGKHKRKRREVSVGGVIALLLILAFVGSIVYSKMRHKEVDLPSPESRFSVVHIGMALLILLGMSGLFSSSEGSSVEPLSPECAANDLAKNRGIELRFFDATWCGACKRQRPVLERVKRRNTYLVFHRIDVDEHRQAAQCYGVRSLPTTVLKRDGRIVEKFVGFRNEDVFQTKLDHHKANRLAAHQGGANDL